MSQHDFDITTADANTGETFRAAVNAALQALASCSCAATAPATTYPYQWWADTTTGLLKMRNAANTDWIIKANLSEENIVDHGGNNIITNVRVGTGSLVGNTEGYANTALGQQSLPDSTTGSGLTAIGSSAGYYNVTGSNNTYIGSLCRQTYDRSSNTLIGANVGFALDEDNCIAIGTGDGSVRAQFTNSNHTWLLMGKLYSTLGLSPNAGTCVWTSGSGSPEGVVTAAVGSLYTRTDGGATTTLYVKTSGSGNTGWTAK